MHVGVPAEIKDHETRTAVTPSLAAALVRRGHEVLVQEGVGLNSGLSDAQYADTGARLVADADTVWSAADLIVKVKEPIEAEYARFRPDQVIFSYLHLAAARECQQALVDAGCTGIAFETVQLADGSLPLLAPMSEIAGRLAVQFGADYLTAPMGGRGLLLGGIAGVAPANVVVIGAGSAGMHATSVAVGLRGLVTVVDLSLDRLRSVNDHYSGRVLTVAGTDHLEVEDSIAEADLVVCAALVPGARAPIIVTEEMLDRMPRGAVVVDVAIDQGGNCAVSRPTTHAEPTFTSHGVLVSCITNLPAAVPRTATFALSTAIAPYVLKLADLGWKAAVAQDPALAGGVNVSGGKVVHPALLQD